MSPTTSQNGNGRGYQVHNQGAQNMTIGEVPHKIPVFDSGDPKSMLAKRKWMLEHMAGAFRVFGAKDYTEGAAGHISIRDPINPDTFWINPLGVHYNMLKASDMVQVDEHGNIVGGSRKAINKAGFMIHSALHKARPDVLAACHTHSIYGKAYSTFGKHLDMINQDACVFYNCHSVYEDFGGVAVEDEEGRKIAQALGPTNKAVILQNHGLLTVGQTVDEAAYLFTLMERSCQAQLLADAAESSGKPKMFIPEQDALFTYNATSDAESLYQEFQPDFEYEVYKAKGDFLDL
ncbi:aldolase, putative class II aldolase/adducin domain protein, putative [Sugiyamaella lignohabitans]|uniref:Aldolase, putative class II aldolase/adducin domain protein, putative n=1 Tax=Sugiyamaella lignohabitans TaxID=796027 RepID=A0A167FEX1_9ASCO|nr:aldolase, putative class II aldolase/adducin domain protein, putative [Sugiyamaella lignohabitans]ANB15213.1 aldolase, putative class II aldolase/adducin domain protein, putative [Sugiyamaella lignohabitans]